MSPYIGTIEVAAGRAAERAEAQGWVFEDLDRNGRRQASEPGIAGVLVSNGREVVRTDAQGRYVLPARDDMALFVVQPSGWRTPTDKNWVPQFAYQHKPAGSPKPLRYGGLAPTGPLPEAVNFPLIRAGDQRHFSCLVIGDSQTYSNIEIGYFRDSVVNDVVDSGARYACALFLGDVAGDDLGLLPRLQAVGGAMATPQYYVHGNHDVDFDADSDADSADSWRRLYGPAYYAFEIGEVLFIVLDNVVYPCGPEDATTPGRDFCLSEARKHYNGRVARDQMIWLENLLAQTPRTRRIVLANHIPFVSFADHASPQHQTDNARDIHALLERRPALSLAGHTHTLENLQPGDGFAGWPSAVGIERLPFQHVIAGAAAGAWWNGDFDMDGAPMSLSRLGEPRGYLTLQFEGADYVDTFTPLGPGRERRMALSFNTPSFRAWFEALQTWRAEPEATRDPAPPFSINDLADVKLLTPADLAGGTWLTANVWYGSSASRVTVSIDGAAPVAMTRTQEAGGEDMRIGAEFADPYAAMRQLSVSRTALQSRSGNAGAQGYVTGRRTATGPRPPQPVGAVADRSLHLWRLRLPVALEEGTHVASVTAIDAHGRRHVDRIVFEVAAERPQPDWRASEWDAFDDGSPVR